MMATVTRAGVTHEETYGSPRTACGRRIGAEHEGWIHAGAPINCRGCKGVLAFAEMYGTAAVDPIGCSCEACGVARERDHRSSEEE